MTIKLYEIDHAIRDTLSRNTDEDGVLDPGCIDALDSLQVSLERKVLDVALYIRSVLGEAGVVREEEKRLQARRHGLENAAARLKEYLLHHTEQHGSKFSDPRVTVSVARTQACDVMSEDALPEAYTFVERKVDRRALLEQLKAGVTVPGARLVSRAHVRIR